MDTELVLTFGTVLVWAVAVIILIYDWNMYTNTTGKDYNDKNPAPVRSSTWKAIRNISAGVVILGVSVAGIMLISTIGAEDTTVKNVMWSLYGIIIVCMIYYATYAYYLEPNNHTNDKLTLMGTISMWVVIVSILVMLAVSCTNSPDGCFLLAMMYS